MGNFSSCLPQTPNHTELENPESRANPLPPFTAPHPVEISTVPESQANPLPPFTAPHPADISTVPASGASTSSAFATDPSNTRGEELDEIPSVVAAAPYALSASSSSAFAAGPSNTGGDDLDETHSMVVAAAHGGTILEDGQQQNFHLFDEKNLSDTVIQFRINVLDHKKTKELSEFRICKHWNTKVPLQGLLNRHTNLAPLEDHPIHDLPIKITILQEADPKSEEAFQRWEGEQKWLKRLVHENVLHPLGYCRYDWVCISSGPTDTVAVVYPSVEQGSLRDILSSNNVIPWDNRISIAVQVARGLAFLHSVPMGFMPCFKDANILLDRNFNVKLSGFGLKSLGHTSKNIFSQQQQYLPPEYPVGRIVDHWSSEGDVFSYGVMLLELIQGNKVDRNANLNVIRNANLNVIRNALQSLEDDKSDPQKLKSNLGKLIDREIKHEYAPDKALQMIMIIKRCLAINPKERPTSSEILLEFV